MNDNCKIIVASVPDREDLVAEVWFDDALFAELRQEGREFLIEIYPRSNGRPWAFGHDDILDVLAAAKKRLLGPVF